MFAIGLFSLSIVYAQTARVQVIHNSADAAAAVVDVYANGSILLLDFEFRTVSAFIDVPAGEMIDVAVLPGDSKDVNDAIANFPVMFDKDETCVVVANGIVSATRYNPAPAFDLDVFALGREAASTTSNTDVLIHHGSTDTPTVDIVEVGAGTGSIIDDASCGDFGADYLELSSGFLNPTNNNDEAAFGLWVVLPDGGELIPLEEETLGLTQNEIDGLALFPNPSSNFITLQGLDGEVYGINIVDLQGRIVSETSISSTNGMINMTSLKT